MNKYVYKGIDGEEYPICWADNRRKEGIFRYYDWNRIRKLIDDAVPKGLIMATLGMKEDWFWTGLDVWSKDKNGFIKTDFGMYIDLRDEEYDSERIVCGINRSSWATPVMKLIYEDGTTELIEVYTKEEYEVY